MSARIRYWPQLELDKPTPLAFAGYKVAMTQTMLVDDRDGSPTKGKEIAVPITIVEAPPLVAVGARVYANGTSEKRVAKEVWSPKLPTDLFRRLVTMKNAHERGEAKIGAQEVPDERAARQAGLNGPTPWPGKSFPRPRSSKTSILWSR
jgi:large subunit ribosomal protein L3